MDLDKLIDSVNTTEPVKQQTANLDSLIDSVPDTTQTDNSNEYTGGRVNIIPTEADLDAQRPMDGITYNQQKEADRQAYIGVPTPDQEALQDSLLDPLTNTVLGKTVEGAINVAGKIVDAVRWPKHLKETFGSWTPEEYEKQQTLYKFMKEQGITPSNALVEGSNGSDLHQFLTHNNLFGTRDAVESQKILSGKYIDIGNKMLKDLEAHNIDLSKLDNWRDIKQAENIVADNVKRLRQSYKDIEKEYYNKVETIAKNKPEEFKVSDFTTGLYKQLTDEGIPPEASNTINTILTRFSKPYKDETKKLAKLNSDRAKILVEKKKLISKQKAAIASGKDSEAVKIEQRMQENSRKLEALDSEKNALKDVRYMTTSDILNTTKLINRKIYKPGGAISAKDADELRGLQIAKNKLEEFLSTNVKDPELQKALQEARNITKTRANLFGAKDTGGEKLMLAKMLDTGEYGKVTEYLTGKNARENIQYIGDVFGKDSEAFRTSLHMYLTNKIGISPETIRSILDTRKATGVLNRVDLNKAAAKISTIDSTDLKMIEKALGKDTANRVSALQKLTTNFADLDDAVAKYGNGIASGKLHYLTDADSVPGMLGRPLKLIKDAVAYHMANVAEKVIYNQPKFRAITGAAVGETVYMANTDRKDISLEGALTSALFGGIGGYYMGKATRSLLESDVQKVARYLKMGRGKPSKDVIKSIENIGKHIKPPETVRDAVLKDEP